MFSEIIYNGAKIFYKLKQVKLVSMIMNNNNDIVDVYVIGVNQKNEEVEIRDRMDGREYKVGDKDRLWNFFISKVEKEYKDQIDKIELFFLFTHKQYYAKYYVNDKAQSIKLI